MMIHRKNRILKLSMKLFFFFFFLFHLSKFLDWSLSWPIYRPVCVSIFVSSHSQSGLTCPRRPHASACLRLPQRNPSASFLLLRLPFSLYLFRESLGAFCICLSNWRCSAGAAKNAKPKEKGKWGDIKKRGKREMQTEIHGKQGTWR